MLGAGALGRPRGMEWGGRREEGSGWGTQAVSRAGPPVCGPTVGTSMTGHTGILLRPPPPPLRESFPWPSHKGRKGLVQGHLSTGELGDETQFSSPRLQPGMPTGQREGEGEWLRGEAAVAGHSAWLGNQWPALGTNSELQKLPEADDLAHSPAREVLTGQRFTE